MKFTHTLSRRPYVRNIGKASKEEFFEELREYLQPLKTEGKRAFFAAYAHEDFTDHDRDKASELRNGLDDVKIFVEKCFLGNERIVSVIRQMKKTFADSLEIPDAGNFKMTHSPALRSKRVKKGRTIWLIIDQSISDANMRHPGDEILLVCYEQVYINQNQFHIFDENKPAWVAHTTIPHTLAGAMLSITKPYWPEKGTVTIGDPFSGSGTVCLEAAKFRNTKVIGGDIDPMGPQLVRDNLQYLWPDKGALKRLLSLLRKYGANDSPRRGTASYLNERMLTSVLNSVEMASEYDQMTRDVRPIEWSEQVGRIRNLSVERRLAFYIGLRAIRRHAAAFERTKSGWHSWYRAFVAEAAQLRQQFERLLALYGNAPLSTVGYGEILQGTYSQSCIIEFRGAYGDKQGKRIEYKMQSAVNDDGHMYDVIITDPPYGINMTEPPDKLANLYLMSLDRMIRALKPNGQLVICLPDETRTGQRVPYFTQRKVVVLQVMQLAYKHRREAIMASYSVPKRTALYRPPYYWDSDRALRRVILHFRFRARRDA